MFKTQTKLISVLGGKFHIAIKYVNKKMMVYLHVVPDDNVKQIAADWSIYLTWRTKSKGKKEREFLFSSSHNFTKADFKGWGWAHSIASY